MTVLCLDLLSSGCFRILKRKELVLTVKNTKNKNHISDKKKYPPITFEYAQEEIAAKAGIKVDTAAGGDMALLQEDLIDVMPAVEEANSISEELDKRVKFEIILISPHMLGKMQGTKAEVSLRGISSAIFKANFNRALLI